VLGDAPHPLAQAAQELALADRLGQPLGLAPQPDVLLYELVRLQRPLDGEQQLGHRERLLDEVVGPEPGCLDCGLDRAMAGHHEHRGVHLVAV
jgi:hypothetical protein